MASANWRGTVGVVKPTYDSGSLVEFIRMLPEGVGVIPVYAGIKEHTERGYLAVMETYQRCVETLASVGVQLIHPEGGPPFMVRGHAEERKIVGEWEEKYRLPVFTSGMTQTAALRALGVERFVGCTYYRDNRLNDIFARYFTDAGFEVLGMEGMDTSPGEAKNLSTEEIYRHIKRSFLGHPNAQAVYLLGSGAWRVADVIAAEEDLGVPVLHPVAARVWYVQKTLRVRQPLRGAGRLLAELP
ncbi:MAG TPA: hypothetical protein VNN77_07160 [candidate division Zixibacteria bacterium]|nr:hypothetical protein [candidate division Zixibacteria bacterium]